MCKQDNARPYCTINENWRGCDKYTSHLAAELHALKSALIRIRDCDWVITLPDRMDAVRQIAREALEKNSK